MPTVLIEYTREAKEGAGYREATSLSRPAPLLEAPTLLPQSVWISEEEKKYDHGDHPRSQSARRMASGEGQDHYHRKTY